MRQWIQALATQREIQGFNLFVFDGNSQTYGSEMSNPDAESYPAITLGNMGSVYQSNTGQYERIFNTTQAGRNFGVPSQTTPDMIADATTQIDPLYNATTYDNNVCILWAGTNDLYFNQNPTTAYNNIRTYCLDRKGVGWTMIILDIIDRRQDDWQPGYSAAQFETDRALVNADLLANWKTFADGLIRVSIDPNIGVNGSANDSTYFTAGKVHLNATGNAYLGDIVHNYLTTLL